MIAAARLADLPDLPTHTKDEPVGAGGADAAFRLPTHELLSLMHALNKFFLFTVVQCRPLSRELPHCSMCLLPRPRFDS